MPNSNKNKLPLCLAPFTGFLVDPNKGVRPCCAWEGNYFGNLKNTPIKEIIEGTEWEELKRKFINQQWPEECLTCKNREEKTGGRSVRRVYFETNKNFELEGLENKITFIELNSSNQCNYACSHCNPSFSTSWLKYWNKEKSEFKRIGASSPLTDEKFITFKAHLPDPSLVIQQLSCLDLSHLETLQLKGGEPFLNNDALEFLKFLDEKDLIKQIRVRIVTNGSQYNQEIVDILSKAKAVSVIFSIDGTGKVQEYIRFGSPSLKEIEENIRNFKENLKEARFDILTSVMAYNAHNILDLAKWWNKLSLEIDIKKQFFASLFVLSPQELSINVLRQKTLENLINTYENSKLKDNLVNLIKLTKNGYLGDDLHNAWIDRTKVNDKAKGINILDYIPELEDELKEV